MRDLVVGNTSFLGTVVIIMVLNVVPIACCHSPISSSQHEIDGALHLPSSIRNDESIEFCISLANIPSACVHLQRISEEVFEVWFMDSPRSRFELGLEDMWILDQVVENGRQNHTTYQAVSVHCRVVEMTWHLFSDDQLEDLLDCDPSVNGSLQLAWEPTDDSTEQSLLQFLTWIQQREPLFFEPIESGPVGALDTREQP